MHVVAKEGGGEFDKSKFASVETIPNFGMEASSYLRFIVKNYDSLPESMAFIHGHEKAQHQRPGIMDRVGEFQKSKFADLNRTVNVHMITRPAGGLGYENIWDPLLKDLGKMPLYVNFRLGAQFVVSADAVRSRPKKFYEDLYDKMMRFCSEKTSSNKHAAMFMEAFWHLIFGVESPLDDRGRPNFFSSEEGELLIAGNISDDYCDLFVDMHLGVYGPAKFMTVLASFAELDYDAVHGSQ